MTGKRTKIPSFYTYFTLFAMAAGSYLAFINVYLDDIGMSKFEIGLLSAIAPLAAMLLQPLFGMAADRARVKNTVAIVLMCLLAVTSGLFMAFRGIIATATLMAVWTSVHSGLLSVSNAIALEHLSELGISERYGRIRLCYSLGYAASGGLLGRLVARDMAWIFPVSSILCLLSLLPLVLLPRVGGKQSEGEKIPWTRIFRYRRLMALFAFAFALALSNSYTYTYMPVYFLRLGGTQELYGYLVFIMAAVETPFLLLSGRLIRRWGAERLMLVPAVSLLLRWILVTLTESPTLVFASNLLHGGGFIVLHLTLARYVADTVEPGLHATGQAMVSAVLFSMSRAIGGLVGGSLAERLCADLGEIRGLHRLFALNAGFVAAVGIALVLTLYYWQKRARGTAGPGCPVQET